MNFLDNLLTTAAGYFGADQANDAKVKLAQLGVNPNTGTSNVADTAKATTSAQLASQWIPGVSNVVVIGAGVGVLALGVVALLVATRKR